jgi:putrescine transport system substrate-binding protein
MAPPRHDPGNEHAVIYMWGTTGIGYNIDMVAERLGEDFEVDSWSLVFDPEIASQLADCGISLAGFAHRHVPAACAIWARPAIDRGGRFRGARPR